MACDVRGVCAYVVAATFFGLGRTAYADAGAPPLTDSGVIFQPGTQPNTLTADLRPPSLCENCHGFYAPYAANDTWKGTMMANAARDPLFYAALTVANQDIANSGEICIRCHSPRAWLFGRSMPPLVQNFQPEDLEGVQCDFCHRLTSGPSSETHIGNARYFVGDDFIRRGPIKDSPAPHDWQYSAYHEESRLCGLCHDVSNPYRDGFAIERTFTEWESSTFARDGKTCQSCHLPSERGPACGAPGMPERDVHRHELVGGNYWMPLVLAGENPALGRGAAYLETAENAKKMLGRAATIAITAPANVTAGAPLAFGVRVTNETGHKLPTGYPEGRRMWLEAIVTDASGRELLHSGGYDTSTAQRRTDAQLRTYEVRLAASGVEGFHFILQNELIQDNRIPPKGFVPRPDTRPVGRNYPIVGDAGDGGETLAHWDDAPYDVVVPSDVRDAIAISVTLWYQTTSREYVESLRDANQTDEHGKRMHALWEKYDRAPPFPVARQVTSLDVLPAPETNEPVPDGGGTPEVEAGGEPSVSTDGGDPLDAGAAPEGAASGCGCRTLSHEASARRTNLVFSLAVTLGLLRRRKRRGQR